MKYILSVLASYAIMGASPVCAAQYLVQANGTVGRIATVDHDVVNLNPDLSGNLTKIGDAISFSFTFDTAGFTPGSLYDADPTINIYTIAPKSVSLTMGGYVYTPSLNTPISSSLQLWNNYAVSPTLIVDNQSFSVFDYPFTNNKAVYPFAIGAGSISESIDVNLFDFTHTARSSDLIGEIVDPSKFGSKQFSYGLLNSTTNLFYNVVSDNIVVSISAVPEPASWLMMIAGIGIVGSSARRRRITAIRATA